jgi:hypothetical protein
LASQTLDIGRVHFLKGCICVFHCLKD